MCIFRVGIYIVALNRCPFDCFRKEIMVMVVTLAIVLNLITQPVIERIRHNRLRLRFKRVKSRSQSLPLS